MLCLLLVALFCFIVIRALSRALRNDDPFMRFAASGPRDPVRHAIRDQHGGEPASHSGQGHDAAVHFLWRLVAAFARLRHGHAAGVDPRTAARGIAGERSRRPGARRERDGRRAARAGGGRRHRRTSVSRRSARAPLWPSAISRSRSQPIPAPPSSPPFRAGRVHVIPSATWRGRDPISIARTGSTLAYGLGRAFLLYGKLKPSVVVGFGGYPTVPPVMAASLRGIPTLIHEQNGVMGRANKFLAGRVSAIATGFAGVTDHDPKLQSQDHMHRQSGAARGGHRGGDAVRDADAGRRVSLAGVRRQPGRARDGGYRAGSGRAARAASAHAAARSCSRRARRICRACATPMRAPRSRLSYRRSFRICRCGWRQAISWSPAPARRPWPSSPRSAGPSILVPLPHALDQDQNANAAVLEKAGGAIPLAAGRISPPTGWPPKSQALPAIRRGSPAWPRARNRPACLTPPINWRNWSSARPGSKR